MKSGDFDEHSTYATSHDDNDATMASTGHDSTRSSPGSRSALARARRRVISYGTSSYGYDVRCAPRFKVFTNIYSATVDPKAFDERSFVDVENDVCVIPPNSFALASTVEYFRIPRDVLTICLGKSTYARAASSST